MSSWGFDQGHCSRRAHMNFCMSSNSSLFLSICHFFPPFLTLTFTRYITHTICHVTVTLLLFFHCSFSTHSHCLIWIPSSLPGIQTSRCPRTKILLLAKILVIVLNKVFVFNREKHIWEKREWKMALVFEKHLFQSKKRILFFFFKKKKG